MLILLYRPPVSLVPNNYLMEINNYFLNIFYSKMYRLFKRLPFPKTVNKLNMGTIYKPINSLLNIHKKNFFKKSNYLLKKDYYSKKYF
jgi:hypothetical protein